MYGKPEGRSSIARSKASHCPQPFQVSNKTTFFAATNRQFCVALRMTPTGTGRQPVTVNTNLLLSRQGIKEGTGSPLSCLSLPWGLIHQMEKPMADWQQPSTLPPTCLFLTYFISFLFLLLVHFFILLLSSTSALCEDEHWVKAGLDGGWCTKGGRPLVNGTGPAVLQQTCLLLLLLFPPSPSPSQAGFVTWKTCQAHRSCQTEHGGNVNCILY